MAKHLQAEIEQLKRKVLYLSAIIEEQLQKAVKAVRARDSQCAAAVIDKDTEIDRMEVDLEEDCLKALALHQPVAIDLRFIIAILKINNDLERIGDLTVNIAERVQYLATHQPIDIPFDFSDMAKRAQRMLKEVLSALIEHDANAARSILTLDDEVDALNREMFEAVQKQIRDNPEKIDSLMNVITISRSIERIADHVTNIAEDVIYMLEGDIVRHRGGAPA